MLHHHIWVSASFKNEEQKIGELKPKSDRFTTVYTSLVRNDVSIYFILVANTTCFRLQFSHYMMEDSKHRFLSDLIKSLVSIEFFMAINLDNVMRAYKNYYGFKWKCLHLDERIDGLLGYFIPMIKKFEHDIWYFYMLKIFHLLHTHIESAKIKVRDLQKSLTYVQLHTNIIRLHNASKSFFFCYRC